MEEMYGPLAPRAFALYESTPASCTRPALWRSSRSVVVDTMYRCPVVAELPGTRPPEIPHGISVRPRRSGSRSERRTAPKSLTSSARRSELRPSGSRDLRRHPAILDELRESRQPERRKLAPWPKFNSIARGYMEFSDNGPVSREGLRRAFCDLYLENVRRLDHAIANHPDGV